MTPDEKPSAIVRPNMKTRFRRWRERRARRWRRDAGIRGNIPQWITAFVAIGAAIFASKVYSQVEIAERAATAQAWQLLTRTQVDISRVFVDKPHLWKYFHDGVAPQDPLETAQASALADMHLDWFDSFDDKFVFDLPRMEAGGEDRLKWEAYFARAFKASPILCQRYAKIGAEYNDTVQRIGGGVCGHVSDR